MSDGDFRAKQAQRTRAMGRSGVLGKAGVMAVRPCIQSEIGGADAQIAR